MNRTIRYAVLAGLGLLLVFYNPFAHSAADYNFDTAKTGAGIYATLRVLNSVMSLARDADLQASVGVASVTASPGQMLQPVIGTIERMANLLFALVMVSGVLSVTLPIISSLGGVLLLLGAGAKAFMPFISRFVGDEGDRVATTVISIGVLSAICIPLAYAAAFLLGDRYTSDAWQRAQSVLNEQAQIIEASSAPETQADTNAQATEVMDAPETASDEGANILDWAKERVGGAVEQTAGTITGGLSSIATIASKVPGQVLSSAKVVVDGVAMASDLFRASVDIGVAYLVKLIVLPALILVGLVWIVRSLARSGGSRGSLAVFPAGAAINGSGEQDEIVGNYRENRSVS